MGTITIADIAHVGALTTVSKSDSVEKAIKILSENKILSAPVMDGNNCAGLLDMIDIAYFISKVSPDDISLNENMLRSLEIAGRAIALEEVGAILNESQRDPFVPVFLSNKASMAVDLFATGIHRVPLRDADDNLVGSLSQTDVVNYLEKHIVEGDMKHLANKTITELSLTANIGDSVLSAVNMLKDKGVSGIGIVDNDNKLVGNFSASDCVDLYQDQLPSLLSNMTEFLEKYSPKSMKPVVVKPDATFVEVIREMSTSHVHHVFVVDANNTPVSVVSITDVMKCIRDYVE